MFGAYVLSPRLVASGSDKRLDMYVHLILNYTIVRC